MATTHRQSLPDAQGGDQDPPPHPPYKNQKPAVQKGVSETRGQGANWLRVSGLGSPTACSVSFQLTGPQSPGPHLYSWSLLTW